MEADADLSGCFEMTRGQRRKLRLSKLYSFSCFRPRGEDKHSQIGQRGYSRIVYCNDPDNPEAVRLNYKGNYVSTTKYTAANFVPKSLFEQFRRVANIYFLVIACLSFSPLAPFTPLSVVGPLVLVIGGTVAKEAVEDWRRRQQVCTPLLTRWVSVWRTFWFELFKHVLPFSSISVTV